MGKFMTGVTHEVCDPTVKISKYVCVCVKQGFVLLGTGRVSSAAV